MWERASLELAFVATGIHALAAILAIAISWTVEYFFFPPVTKIIWRQPNV